MKWIPVSERLPDDNREVLISLEWGIDIGTYERGEWRSEWINHYDDDNVLAWMPLPKPYKADRKTEPTISKMEQVEDEQIETQTETKNSNLTFEKVMEETQAQVIEFPDTHQKFIFTRKIEMDGDSIKICGWEYKGVKDGEREGE